MECDNSVVTMRSKRLASLRLVDPVWVETVLGRTPPLRGAVIDWPRCAGENFMHHLVDLAVGRNLGVPTPVVGRRL